MYFAPLFDWDLDSLMPDDVLYEDLCRAYDDIHANQARFMSDILRGRGLDAAEAKITHLCPGHLHGGRRGSTDVIHVEDPRDPPCPYGHLTKPQ